MCVNTLFPTWTPDSSPHVLEVLVEPWEQLELAGGVDITGQWLWVDGVDPIYVFLVEDCVQTALRHTTQD